MSLEIPSNPAGPNGTYWERPDDFTSALEEARKLLKELESSSDWESMPEREEVELSKIVDPDNAADIPITRGSTIVEGATPLQMMGVLQLPGEGVVDSHVLFQAAILTACCQPFSPLDQECAKSGILDLILVFPFADSRNLPTSSTVSCEWRAEYMHAQTYAVHCTHLFLHPFLPYSLVIS